MLSSATIPSVATQPRGGTSRRISGQEDPTKHERMADETAKTHTSRRPLGVRWPLVALVGLLLLAGRGSGSELPDRECCDSAPPPPPHYHTSTSTTTSTTPQPPAYGKHPIIYLLSHYRFRVSYLFRVCIFLRLPSRLSGRENNGVKFVVSISNFSEGRHTLQTGRTDTVNTARSST